MWSRKIILEISPCVPRVIFITEFDDILNDQLPSLSLVSIEQDSKESSPRLLVNAPRSLNTDFKGSKKSLDTN